MKTEANRTVERLGRVALLMGGWSAERDISLKSGAAVLQALQQQGIDVEAIDVQRDTILDRLQQGDFGAAFNILHGPGGEDGVIQAVLELLNIPYTGSGVMASAISMDKLRTKQLLDGIGLPTPPYMVLDAESDYEYIAATLGLPLIVKPALEGSSVGMSKVEDVADMHAAWLAAAEFNGAVFAEQWIDGGEYTVSILDNKPLPVIQLKTPHSFYDYEAKYVSDDTEYLCPAPLSEEVTHQYQRLALSAFQAVDADGWGRVDLMVDQQGRAWIIEVNTVPGMTDHSLVPMAAKAAGLAFDELVLAILESAFNRHEVQSA